MRIKRETPTVAIEDTGDACKVLARLRHSIKQCNCRGKELDRWCVGRVFEEEDRMNGRSQEYKLMAAQMECTKSHCFTWSDWIRKKYVAVSRLSSKLELERLKVTISIGKINHQSSRPELTSWGWKKARKR